MSGAIVNTESPTFLSADAVISKKAAKVEAADALIVNTSGMQPVEYKILILPELVEETDAVMKAAKAAGIQIVHETKEREEMAQIKGVLVAVGGNAFQDWQEPRPKVGDRIYFAKYAGINVPGADGKKYRLTNDKDVSAILI